MKRVGYCAQFIQFTCYAKVSNFKDNYVFLYRPQFSWTLNRVNQMFKEATLMNLLTKKPLLLGLW